MFFVLCVCCGREGQKNECEVGVRERGVNVCVCERGRERWGVCVSEREVGGEGMKERGCACVCDDWLVG